MALWGSNFLVNTSTEGAQNEVFVSALGNGSFVAVWSNFFGTAAPFIKGQMFNADGTSKGSEFTIDAGSNLISPALTVLSGERFVVTWYDGSELATSGAKIQARLFGSNGQPLGSKFTLNTLAEGPRGEPSVTALTNGGFAVTFSDYELGTIRTRAFDRDGNPSPENTVSTTTANLQDLAATAGLANGRFVVVFADESLSADDHYKTIRGRIMKADGTPDSIEFLVPSSGFNKTEPSVATLSDGRFVVTWTTCNLSQRKIMAQIFNPDGSRSGDELAIFALSIGSPSKSDVIALPDGGFAVTYWVSGTGTGLEEIRISRFNSAGAHVGTDEKIGPGLADGRVFGTPDLALLPDGRLVVSWGERPNIPGALTDARAQIVDMRTNAVDLQGTAADDQYIGTGFGDNLRGADGHDLLRGEAGNDTLDGGNGDDVLNGGAGADVMNGGAGNDVYYIDDANDRIVDTSGIDTVYLAVSYDISRLGAIENITGIGSASITLTGSDGNNAMSGGDGADILYGGKGRDVLDGGAGNDRIHGQDGNDTLTGGSGRDIFVFDKRPNKSSNVDKITDFNVRDDSIYVDNLYFKVGTGSLSKPKQMASKFFYKGAKAHDADDRIIYDQKKGILYYDKDGDGAAAAVKIATLDHKPGLGIKDFFVI